MLPNKLYHGSAHLAHAAIMPGFMHTHKLVEWDGTENNKFLYATSDRQTALDQAVASLLENRWSLVRFKSDGSRIELWFDGEAVPTKEQLSAEKIWVYTIAPKPLHRWVKVNNKENNLDDEWKTAEVVVFSARQEVSVGDWLKGEHITIHRA
jgi:hypothetical protein